MVRWKRGSDVYSSLYWLWSSPFSALAIFGILFFVLNAITLVLRITWRLLCLIFYLLVCVVWRLPLGLFMWVRKWTCRAKSTHMHTRVPHPHQTLHPHESRRVAVVRWSKRRSRPVPLHLTLRYGNGYDTLLRLTLTLIELAWLVQFSWSMQQNKGFKFFTVPYLASVLLPLSPHHIVKLIEIMLGITALMDAKRVFNACAGAQPMRIPNGWESCPLCEALWKTSRKASDHVHICPWMQTP